MTAHFSQILPQKLVVRIAFIILRGRLGASRNKQANGCAAPGAGCARLGEGIAMFRAWMTHEHWLIWIAAAIVFILALAAIGYLSAPEYF
jgi:nicotinamide riboside transporter PnuC